MKLKEKDIRLFDEERKTRIILNQSDYIDDLHNNILNLRKKIKEIKDLLK